ncbi:Uma2 family endonuclease [Streptomyces stramineus]
MADSDELSLDMLFDWLERMPVPEGYKVEIVEGAIYMSPQRDTHWEIIADIFEQLRAKYPRQRIKSDVRIDYPGHLNGLASDVVVLKEGAVKNHKGRWQYEDVEFIAEVISKDTAQNDYGPKKDAYALAGVPVYLIVDPYKGKCLLFTDPKDGGYRCGPALKFGDPIDLTGTVVGLTLATDEFPRD